MNIEVLTVHGDYATGDLMRQDMGDPAWVDEHLTWRSFMDVADAVCKPRPTILIGYSRGAEHARRLLKCDSVIAAIAYEPLATGPLPVNNKPKLLITNRYGRSSWNSTGRESANRWTIAGNYETLQGSGAHIALRWRWPPVGHAWDKSLNEHIAKWIERVKDESQSK